MDPVGADEENCGACGRACEWIEPCETGCDAWESCCWEMGVEECRVTEDDPLNCGGCGNVCPVGTLCRDGLCLEWYNVLSPCPSGYMNCGRDGTIDCRDLTGDDDDNCGGCDKRCSDTAECQGGICIDFLEADAFDSGEEE